MEERLNALSEAFLEYRADLIRCEKKQRPTDGLLGFGHALKDDACHEKFDDRAAAAVQAVCEAEPSATEAESAVRMLLESGGEGQWPLAAQWMLRAAERHALPLIPFLMPGTAAELAAAYAKRYKPWDRLPAQKEVLKALKTKGKA